MSGRWWLALVAIAAAGFSSPQSQNLPRGIDQQDRDRIEAAIREAFPNAADWVLSAAHVGHVDPSTDRRVHVDVPARAVDGRVARHVRFSCKRRKEDRSWSCGGSWQMLWQAQRLGAGSRRCTGPVIGLNASQVSDEQVILDIVDFFSDTGRANAALEAAAGCRRLEPENLCRLSNIAPGSSWHSGVVAADFDAQFVTGPGSRAIVQLNRHCTGAGPCLVEIAGCGWLEAN